MHLSSPNFFSPLKNEIFQLIDKARDYFGLSDLEKTTEVGGILNVHIGDVFIPSENLCRRYAGQSFVFHIT